MLSDCQFLARMGGLTSAASISSIIQRNSSGLYWRVGSNSLSCSSDFGLETFCPEVDDSAIMPVSILAWNSSIEFIASTRGRSDFLIIWPTGRATFSSVLGLRAYMMLRPSSMLLYHPSLPPCCLYREWSMVYGAYMWTVDPSLWGPNSDLRIDSVDFVETRPLNAWMLRVN